VIEIAAAIALITGWKTRWAAWTLIFCTTIVTVFLHSFAGADTAQYFNELSHVMKKLGVTGGLLYIAVYGGGSSWLDPATSRSTI